MMIYSTFSGSAPLTGLAMMLQTYGITTNDETIALGMEAPYLLIHENGCYRAGAGLFQPPWINLYLHSLGFHMEEHLLTKADICSWLRACSTAMLQLTPKDSPPLPVVYSAYQDGRYRFSCIKTAGSKVPDTLSLTAAMLKRRLPEVITAFTISPCAPSITDFGPLLLASRAHLDSYLADLVNARRQCMTRAEFQAMHAPLFRALMRDLKPVSMLIPDITLAEELHLLEHDYTHVFTMNSPPKVELRERLPIGSIKLCISWWKEDINDRLFSLGLLEY